MSRGRGGGRWGGQGGGEEGGGGRERGGGRYKVSRGWGGWRRKFVWQVMGFGEVQLARHWVEV